MDCKIIFGHKIFNYDSKDDQFCYDGDHKYMILPDFDSDKIIYADSFTEALAIVDDLNEEESEVNR